MSARTTKRSQELLEVARTVIPGGVNSPVRAFQAVGGAPLFIASAKGAHITDVDRNSYVDYVGSWGPMILGHGNDKTMAAISEAASKGWSYGAPSPLEADLAEEVCRRVPSVEMVRMVNSGTEATLSALRLARAATGRNRIVKFSGCYHGHHDGLLVAAGSGLATFGTPSSPGVTPGTTADTIVCHFNDLDSVAAAFQDNPDEIACVIVEPVAGNMGVVAPAEGFLEGLRRMCTSNGALLILDEVMTGFRVAKGCAQERFGVTPDLTTMGKVIGGGLPVGAYGGRADLMRRISPEGDVYQAGTLSGNPLAMAAGLATLSQLDDAAYARLEALGALLEEHAQVLVGKYPDDLSFQRVGSMATLFFKGGGVRSWDDAAACDTERFGKYFLAMLDEGIYLPPSQFEAYFISLAHSDGIIDRTGAAMARCVAKAIAG